MSPFEKCQPRVFAQIKVWLLFRLFPLFCYWLFLFLIFLDICTLLGLWFTDIPPSLWVTFLLCSLFLWLHSCLESHMGLSAYVTCALGFAPKTMLPKLVPWSFPDIVSYSSFKSL